ncbi:MAG: FKBP-type peptidyl-prolyl cis-trans isomerase [Prevotellaceae bacterium]|jgi:FKBP-type peptidyl-prolyl cis-trans isomerase SlyD|nr:FKBP-type peptidyl-prolyl cis-trans isomerase [Prevotellaceae bacterium]
MKIEQNRIVSLTYNLETDGELMETVHRDQPMKFMFGVGHLLPKFEEQIAGKVAGESFDFVLAAADAYGEYQEEALVDLPREMFEIDGEFDEETIAVGAQIPMRDADGNRLYGIVDTVDDTTVRMDFNHPMAGFDLHFSGEIVEVREATPEDLAGACSCSGCGSGSSGGCCCDEDPNCCCDDDPDCCCEGQK